MEISGLEGRNMKKIINIYTALLSVIITLVMTYNASISNQVKIASFLDTICKESNSDELFFISFNNYEDISTTSLISKLTKVADERNTIVNIVVSYEIVGGYRTVVNYIYSPNNKDLFQSFPMSDSKIINFHKKTKEYYSTDITDKNATNYFQYLSDKYYSKAYNAIVVKSLYEYIENGEQWVNVSVDFMTQSPDAFINQIYNTFEVPLEERYSYSVSEYTKREQEFNIEYIYICALISCCLLFLCYFLKSLQEINIRKMFGNSTFIIIKKMFFSVFLKCFCLLVFFQILMLGILVNDRMNAAIELIKTIVMFDLVFFLFLILILFLLSAFINYTHYHNLKNKEMPIYVEYFNLLFKTVSMILLLPSIIVLDVLPYQSLIHYMNLLTSEYRDGTYMVSNGVNPIYSKTTSWVETDYQGKRDFYNIMEEFDLIYCDELRAMFTRNLIENNELDELYSENSGIPYEELLVVNKKYIHEFGHKYISLDGKNIDIDNLTEKPAYLLVPENRRIENIEKYIYPYEIDEVPTIGIKSQNIYNTLIPMYDDTYINPVVLLVNEYKDDLSLDPVRAIFRLKDKKDVEVYERLLKDANLTEKVRIENFEDLYAYGIEYYFDRLLTYVTYIYFYLTLLLSFVYQYIYLFLLRNRKDLAIKYLNGYSKSKLFKKLLLSNLTIYSFVVLIFIIVLQLNWFVSISCALLVAISDLIFSFTLIQKFLRKQILVALKGDDN